MSTKPTSDWNPRSEAALKDQISVYDEMRQRCPVAHSEFLHWSLFRHADVLRVLNDHETFSNAVSHHLSVPNGMDPPQHSLYRHIIEPYFSEQRMADFEPVCRDIAANLVQDIPMGGEVELISCFAQRFALQIQCAFLGWPDTLQEPLRLWCAKNHQATLAGDTDLMNALALEFDGYIKSLLSNCRDSLQQSASAPFQATAVQEANNITHCLLRDQIGGEPLSDDEIISILRNWTVGELGTISASIGILCHYLAEQPTLQQQLREHPESLPKAIDEILRIHSPLIANRRITTKPVDIGGRKLEAGERISLIWASANRDEAVFGDADAFLPDRDPSLNLLYGAGIHVCPGAPLARMELVIIMEELLSKTDHIRLLPDKNLIKAVYPASGFSTLPLWIE